MTTSKQQSAISEQPEQGRALSSVVQLFAVRLFADCCLLFAFK
jgi:hypothetical protein